MPPPAAKLAGGGLTWRLEVSAFGLSVPLHQRHHIELFRIILWISLVGFRSAFFLQAVRSWTDGGRHARASHVLDNVAHTTRRFDRSTDRSTRFFNIRSCSVEPALARYAAKKDGSQVFDHLIRHRLRPIFFHEQRCHALRILLWWIELTFLPAAGDDTCTQIQPYDQPGCQRQCGEINKQPYASVRSRCMTMADAESQHREREVHPGRPNQSTPGTTSDRCDQQDDVERAETAVRGNERIGKENTNPGDNADRGRILFDNASVKVRPGRRRGPVLRRGPSSQCRGSDRCRIRALGVARPEANVAYHCRPSFEGM